MPLYSHTASASSSDPTLTYFAGFAASLLVKGDPTGLSRQRLCQGRVLVIDANLFEPFLPLLIPPQRPLLPCRLQLHIFTSR